ncbi:cbb3-type cytochrome oxidase assembly protein CcoS [Atopomonas sediminilitoris]|uniref:cbb3-type cytochrome oxidase assembly protein CcoS n=1 Tax=Atopomonas sediminilitoris TaxID=2919919 RepID=UPI001F4EE4A6|nr:cbb3-type cytochrome oxidase assembly protein CcoS [Atopomonas sediminilitoris]MCJ8169182.1 cbb3-type cytochrome oxidase assembly protein CcoS [Atopomonas sediminilitoris]
MNALYYLIPIAIILVIAATWLFFWAVDSGQYDDLDGPAHSILFDDDDPAHQAAQPEHSNSTGSQSAENNSDKSA